jgi:hypothetical protein
VHDGADFTITVITENGTYSVRNSDDGTFREFLKVILDYKRSFYDKAEDTVVSR